MGDTGVLRKRVVVDARLARQIPGHRKLNRFSDETTRGAEATVDDRCIQQVIDGTDILIQLCG